MKTKFIFALIAVLAFNSCKESEVKPKVDPFKNEASLNVLGGLFSSELKKLNTNSNGRIQNADYVATVEKVFEQYQKNHPELQFGAVDETKLNLYMKTWNTALNNTLNKLDQDNTSKEMALKSLNETTKSYCVEVSLDGSLSDSEKQGVIDQIMMKNVILIASWDSLLSDETSSANGKTAFWGWLKKRAKCISSTASAIFYCGSAIVVIVKTGGTAALAGKKLVLPCLSAIAGVIANC